MAESTSPKGNSGDFAKKVQRQLSRGKEKVMQRLGKSMETRDDQFECSLQMFNDQQTDGNRMYKDLRNYIDAIRDMREASRRLSQSLFDVYESDWAGEEDLGAIVEGEDLLWNDHEVKMLDQVVRTMESYVGQFPDIREKIAKRGRKRVDYDSSLHTLESLQTAKKRDDIKISKAKEEMLAAKNIYDGINNELKEELPVLYDSRIGCYVAVFSAVSNLRDIFYKEMSTLNLDLQCVIKELQAQHPDKTFAVRGLQRYGSLKRRILLSPRAWKASFSEFNRTYNPRMSLRSSLKSPDKPRHSTLSRDSSTLGFSSRSSTLNRSLTESRELDTTSCHSENRSSVAQEEAAAGTSGKEKSGAASGQAEEGKSSKEVEDKKDGEKAPPSESSSELNNSCESESLELQLSAAQSETLHIEEEEEEEEETSATLDSQKANGLKNGDVGALNSDTSNLRIPQKEGAGEKQAPHDSKTTTV
ncbi:PREDICTED: bridging integrator 2-like [Poecilia mexicana]|uniref:BAR domain-containing protein n=2 Tax=Poecilia mexicana TaxID=48701 RepID=A0A3B3Z519_9TELE|nr:PREDICTED: bridging integrator 2 [Poecilia mexicana]XP_014841281.1 PREDICTED: bridging integrator 2-like [Poecilia mexicana]